MLTVQKFDAKRGWCDGIKASVADAKAFIRLNPWGYRAVAANGQVVFW